MPRTLVEEWNQALVPSEPLDKEIPDEPPFLRRLRRLAKGFEGTPDQAPFEQADAEIDRIVRDTEALLKDAPLGPGCIEGARGAETSEFTDALIRATEAFRALRSQVEERIGQATVFDHSTTDESIRRLMENLSARTLESEVPESGGDRMERSQNADGPPSRVKDELTTLQLDASDWTGTIKGVLGLLEKRLSRASAHLHEGLPAEEREAMARRLLEEGRNQAVGAFLYGIPGHRRPEFVRRLAGDARTLARLFGHMASRCAAVSPTRELLAPATEHARADASFIPSVLTEMAEKASDHLPVPPPPLERPGGPHKYNLSNILEKWVSGMEEVRDAPPSKVAVLTEEILPGLPERLARERPADLAPLLGALEKLTATLPKGLAARAIAENVKGRVTLEHERRMFEALHQTHEGPGAREGSSRKEAFIADQGAHLALTRIRVRTGRNAPNEEASRRDPEDAMLGEAATLLFERLRAGLHTHRAGRRPLYPEVHTFVGELTEDLERYAQTPEGARVVAERARKLGPEDLRAALEVAGRLGDGRLTRFAFHGLAPHIQTTEAREAKRAEGPEARKPALR